MQNKSMVRVVDCKTVPVRSNADKEYEVVDGKYDHLLPLSAT